MKVLNKLFQNEAELERYIIDNEIQDGAEWLVHIHASTSNKQFCVKLASFIKALIPSATVVGCTTAGVIYNADIVDDGILITFRNFEKASFRVEMFSIDAMTNEEIVARIEKDSEKIAPSLAIIWFGFFYTDVENLIDKLAEKLPQIPFAGGTAGFQDETLGVVQCVFDGEDFYEDRICMTYISGDFALSYTNVIVGHTTISDRHEVTSIKGKYIEEIDDKPAGAWLSEQFGATLPDTSKVAYSEVASNTLLRFPFVLDGRDGASRFIQYDGDTGCLKQYGSYPSVIKDFKIGYLSPVRSVEEWQMLCYDLLTTPVQTIFNYSCLFRKMYLNNLSKWEMLPFAEHNICGAFMFGEIGTKNDHTYYYNGTCSLFTIAEKEEYIAPDLSVYEKMLELDDVNEEIASFLRNVVQQSGEKASGLVQNAVSREKLAKGHLIESQDSIVGFLKDSAQLTYKKLGMITYENAREISADREDIILSSNIAAIKDYVQKKFPDAPIALYRYGVNTFFFAVENSVKDSEFVEIAKNIHSFCNGAAQAKINLCKNFKCVLTLNGHNPHELYHFIKEHMPETNTDFAVYDEEHDETALLQKEFEMVEIIKEALLRDRVIPYFQGIYDSKESRFFAYEALMRIQTSDGQILPPGAFLDVAKKYGYYKELSLKMVCKVLDMFADRQEIITLNISTLDVHSTPFKEAVLSKLSNMKDPSHFIFELVESEQYAGHADLREFLLALKRFGVKIAVDDFGSGYSNFIEIGNLDIDYLKINGSLTDLLGTDVSYDGILDSITYLGKKMQAELIAECVETASMQKTLVNKGVRYSQGYLFSKPMPEDELYVVAEENKSKASKGSHGSKESTPEAAYNYKRRKLGILLGAIITVLLVVGAIFTFTSNNLREVEEINDSFLIELATGMADKISFTMEDSETLLRTTELAIISHYPEVDNINDLLCGFTDVGGFNDVYVAVGDAPPRNGKGEELVISEPYSLEGATTTKGVIMPPVIELSTGRELFAVGIPMLRDSKVVAELYGIYYLDEFAHVLDLKSFGGEAFYHLCQVDGKPLIISGNTNNLFAGGDMYSFIGTLDIQNGHTPESIKVDMENGKDVLLKYNANGDSRSAVMVTVPGTDWCVVSIVQSEVAQSMVDRMDSYTLIFAVVVIIILGIFSVTTLISGLRSEKILKKALESSHYLTNSLQATVETDALTKTYSRAAAQEKITEAILRNRERDVCNTLLILDVDNFKTINDTYGHQTGDTFLMEFVSATKGSLRTGDILGRMGGDEFMVLLSDVGTRENAEKVVNRMIENVNAINIKDVDLSEVGMSVGAVMVSDYKDCAYEKLNLMADKALYAAKNSGKNGYVFYGDSEWDSY